MALRILKLTAFITVDEKDEEGIISFYNPSTSTYTPMVGADDDRIKSLYPLAVEICTAHGRKLKIIEFAERKDITEEIIQKYH